LQDGGKRRQGRKGNLFLKTLFNFLRTSHSPLVELINEARELDLHYIPSRYPNGIPSGYPHQFYGRKNADQALAATEKIFNAIKDYYLAGEHEDIIEFDEKL
jgi:HEPN domain-containing protein